MRIWVRGVSCSGKTTLARKLSNELNLPHLELDQLFWLPDWIQRDREEFREILKDKLSSEDWVIDGNYSMIEQIMHDNWDFLIWLNPPFHVVLRRAFSRTFKRIKTKELVCNGNIETWKNFFTIDGNMIIWVLKTYRRRQKQLQEAKKQFSNVVEVRCESDLERFITNLKKRLNMSP